MTRKLCGFAACLLAFTLPASAQERAEITINATTRVAPENLTSSADGTVFFGSTATGTIYRALPNAAQAEAWILAEANNLTNVLGVLADDKSNTLWVCVNAPFGRNAGGAGQTALRAFDLKSGAAKGNFPSPDGGVLNDVAIAPDGTAYASDTFGGRIVRLKPGAPALDVWLVNAELRGVDGLSFLADGALYVNNVFNGKLQRIAINADGSGGPIVEIQTSLPFSRPDGLRASGPKTLLQAEGAGRLTEITIEGERGTVRVLKDGLNRSLGVTQIGNTAWILVEQLKAIAVPISAP